MAIRRIVFSVPHSTPETQDKGGHPYDSLAYQWANRAADTLKGVDIQAKLVRSTDGRSLVDANRSDAKDTTFRQKIRQMSDEDTLLIDAHSYPKGEGDFSDSQIEIFKFGNQFDKLSDWTKEELQKRGWKVYLVTNSKRTGHSDIVNETHAQGYPAMLIEVSEDQNPEAVGQAFADIFKNLIRGDNKMRDPNQIQNSPSVGVIRTMESKKKPYYELIRKGQRVRKMAEDIQDLKIKTNIRERINTLHHSFESSKEINDFCNDCGRRVFASDVKKNKCPSCGASPLKMWTAHHTPEETRKMQPKPYQESSKEMLYRINKVERRIDDIAFKENLRPKDITKLNTLQEKLHRMYESMNKETIVQQGTTKSDKIEKDYAQDINTKEKVDGKTYPDDHFDPNELSMGTKAEMEHTDDPVVAKNTAKDHLVEISDYYTRLKKMEDEAKAHNPIEEKKIYGKEYGKEITYNKSGVSEKIEKMHESICKETYSPDELMNRGKHFGIYISYSVGGGELDARMDKLDLKNHKDYEYATNQKLDNKPVGILFLLTDLAAHRWSGSGSSVSRGFERAEEGEVAPLFNESMVWNKTDSKDAGEMESHRESSVYVTYTAGKTVHTKDGGQIVDEEIKTGPFQDEDSAKRFISLLTPNARKSAKIIQESGKYLDNGREIDVGPGAVIPQQESFLKFSSPYETMQVLHFLISNGVDAIPQGGSVLFIAHKDEPKVREVLRQFGYPTPMFYESRRGRTMRENNINDEPNTPGTGKISLRGESGWATPEEFEQRAAAVMKVATPEQKKVFHSFESGDEKLFLNLLGNQPINPQIIDKTLEVSVNNVEGDTSQLTDEEVKYARKKGWLDGWENSESHKESAEDDEFERLWRAAVKKSGVGHYSDNIKWIAQQMDISVDEVTALHRKRLAQVNDDMHGHAERYKESDGDVYVRPEDVNKIKAELKAIHPDIQFYTNKDQSGYLSFAIHVDGIPGGNDRLKATKSAREVIAKYAFSTTTDKTYKGVPLTKKESLKESVFYDGPFDGGSTAYDSEQRKYKMSQDEKKILVQQLRGVSGTKVDLGNGIRVNKGKTNYDIFYDQGKDYYVIYKIKSSPDYSKLKIEVFEDMGWEQIPEIVREGIRERINSMHKEMLR